MTCRTSGHGPRASETSSAREGHDGWKKAELEPALKHTALAVMHAWDGDTREEYPGWHRAAEYIPRADAIYRNVQHLASFLVDDILALSQIEAERLPLIQDRVDLEEDVVKKAIGTVRPLAEHKGLYLHAELSEGPPWVPADHVRLRQVLLNLLMNAIRLTESGGVAVRTARVNSELVVSVHDTGPGIAAQDLPKLFEEFQQVAKAGQGRKAPESSSSSTPATRPTSTAPRSRPPK